MGHRPKLGSYGKNWIFGPKTEIWAQKKAVTFGLFNALLWVGWWLWRAGCISQDTYLLYKKLSQ